MRGLITMRKSAGEKFEMRESPAECGRIGNSGVPAIVVRFKNRTDRNLFYSSRFHLKDKDITNLGYQKQNITSSTSHNIFINQSLSVHIKYLFKQAREHCKKIGFKNCYTSSGMIYVRKEKDSYRYSINKEEDLHNIK